MTTIVAPEYRSFDTACRQASALLRNAKCAPGTCSPCEKYRAKARALLDHAAAEVCAAVDDETCDLRVVGL